MRETKRGEGRELKLRYIKFNVLLMCFLERGSPPFTFGFSKPLGLEVIRNKSNALMLTYRATQHANVPLKINLTNFASVSGKESGCKTRGKWLIDSLFIRSRSKKCESILWVCEKSETLKSHPQSRCLLAHRTREGIKTFCQPLSTITLAM